MFKVIVGSLSAMALFSGCYLETVDSTQVGVKKHLGEVQKEVAPAGLAIDLMPFHDLYTMTIANKMANFSGGDKPDSATELNEPAIVVITSDDQNKESGMGIQVPLDISIMYQLDPKMAPNMMAKFGPDGTWDAMLIVKETRSSVRDAIGQVTLGVLNKNRESYEVKIQALMNNKLNPYGVKVTNVAIRNIGVPKAIQDAVLAKATAQQNAEKAKYQVEQAKAEAEVEVAKAKGVADANDVLAGSLTDRLVKYKELEIQRVQADKWNGALPTTMLGNNTSMLMQLGK